LAAYDRLKIEIPPGTRTQSIRSAAAPLFEVVLVEASALPE
jgi:hypothetical protein